MSISARELLTKYNKLRPKINNQPISEEDAKQIIVDIVQLSEEVAKISSGKSGPDLGPALGPALAHASDLGTTLATASDLGTTLAPASGSSGPASTFPEKDDVIEQSEYNKFKEVHDSLLSKTKKDDFINFYSIIKDSIKYSKEITTVLYTKTSTNTVLENCIVKNINSAFKQIKSIFQGGIKDEEIMGGVLVNITEFVEEIEKTIQIFIKLVILNINTIKFVNFLVLENKIDSNSLTSLKRYENNNLINKEIDKYINDVYYILFDSIIYLKFVLETTNVTLMRMSNLNQETIQFITLIKKLFSDPQVSYDTKQLSIYLDEIKKKSADTRSATSLEVMSGKTALKKGDGFDIKDSDVENSVTDFYKKSLANEKKNIENIDIGIDLNQDKIFNEIKTKIDDNDMIKNISKKILFAFVNANLLNQINNIGDLKLFKRPISRFGGDTTSTPKVVKEMFTRANSIIRQIIALKSVFNSLNIDSALNIYVKDINLDNLKTYFSNLSKSRTLSTRRNVTNPVYVNKFGGYSKKLAFKKMLLKSKNNKKYRSFTQKYALNEYKI